MSDQLLKYWPILLAVLSAVFVLVQTSFTVGEVHESTTAATHRVEQELDRHEQKAGHEQTAIRLERIETQQTTIARDVVRIQGQLDTMSADIREALIK